LGDSKVGYPVSRLHVIWVIPFVAVRDMQETQRYVEGYATGWASVMGPRLILPEVPSPPTQTSGSLYILGLLNGIEAATNFAKADPIP
jgi:hypothetical protein